MRWRAAVDSGVLLKGPNTDSFTLPSLKLQRRDNGSKSTRDIWEKLNCLVSGRKMERQLSLG